MKLEQHEVESGGYYYESYMTPHMFQLTDFFKNYDKYKKTGRGDNWGDFRFVRVPLVYWLDEMRDLADCPINIHCGYEERDSGWHPSGLAADIHVVGMSLVDQLLLALKFPFNGVGVYPFWWNKGLHVDLRPLIGYKKSWYRDEQGVYHKLHSVDQIK